MIHALALILLCQLAGEALSRLFNLPAPGPVLGMGLLFLLMLTVPRLGDFMRPTGEGILRHLTLLFVPAGVGIVGHLRQLGENGLALGVALVASTVLAIAAGVLTFVFVARLTGAKGSDDA